MNPRSLRQSLGRGFGDGAHFSFVCGACNRRFTRVSPDTSMNTNDMPVVPGPAFCYQGNHTIKPVSGDRRVFSDVVSLVPGSLQQDIDALDGKKALEELQIEGIEMREILLDETLTPNLKVIKLTSVDLEGGMPIQHYRPLPSSVSHALLRATGRPYVDD